MLISVFVDQVNYFSILAGFEMWLESLPCFRLPKVAILTGLRIWRFLEQIAYHFETGDFQLVLVANKGI